MRGCLSINWARRYEAMPPAERLAVLSAVMAVEAHEPEPGTPSQ